MQKKKKKTAKVILDGAKWKYYRLQGMRMFREICRYTVMCFERSYS